MYGERARIGYTSPLLVSEVFPYEFYRVAPQGVTLALATLDVWGKGERNLEASYERTLRAARAMADVGVDLIVLGGVPVLAKHGPDAVDDLVAELQDELGVAVTSVAAAYRNAATQLGARKVVVQEALHTSGDDVLAKAGFEILASSGAVAGTVNMTSTRQDSQEIAASARELVRAHPGADTLWINWPHRPTLDQVEPLERELGVNVASASLAIIWQSLRLCGVNDSIEGFGRLLREPGSIQPR